MTYCRIWIASLLATALLASPGLGNPMPLRAVKRDATGLSVTLDPGMLRLEVCSDRIFRVSYSPTVILPKRQDFSVVKQLGRCPVYRW